MMTHYGDSLTIIENKMKNRVLGLGAKSINNIIN